MSFVSKLWLVEYFFSNFNVRKLLVRQLPRIAAIVGFTAAAWLFRWWIRSNIDYIRTVVLASLAKRPVVNSQHYRSVFTSVPVPYVKLAEGHTHANSARERSRAVGLMEAFANLMGKQHYVVAKSFSDVKNKRQGTRLWYWTKDVHIAPGVDAVHSDAIKAYVDDDYFRDMPYELARDVYARMIYTFVPSAAAGATGEFCFTFNGNSEVHYRVTGSGEYRHKLWDYGNDSVMATRWIWIFPISSTIYAVERRNIDDHHQVILLVPEMTWDWRASWLCQFLDNHVVKRLEVVAGSFARLRVQTEDGLKVSTAGLSCFTSVTVPVAVDETLAVMARIADAKLTISSVQTYLAACEERSTKDQAALLTDFHTSKVPLYAPTVFPVRLAVRRYFFDKFKAEDPKPTMVAFMAPILHEAYVPDKCKTNEAQSISARITKIKTDVLPNLTMIRHMREFSDLVVAGFAGTLHPLGCEEVAERQSRPTQRAILRAADINEPVRVARAFMKRESYQKVTDPRNITTFNANDKLQYSRYIYALADEISKATWYGFSKTPFEISTIVAEICREAFSVVKTDFKRYDGKVSQVLRDLEQMVLMKSFHRINHNELLDLHSGQFNLRGYGKFGTEYEMGTSRGSGSTETAVFNTLENKFMAYLAFRAMGMSPAEAYAWPGIYGGDDGLTPDVNVDSYVNVCAKVGQQLEIEPVKRGSSGVEFLARMYGPDVWNGDTANCCDIRRTLSKLHVTCDLQVVPLEKLSEKIESLRLTDVKTPLIKDLIAKWDTFVVDGLVRKFTSDSGESFWSRYRADDNFSRTMVDRTTPEWMFDLIHKQIPGLDLEFYSKLLLSRTAPVQLLSLPLCTDVTKPARTQSGVAMPNDDDVFEPEESKPPTSVSTSSGVGMVSIVMPPSEDQAMYPNYTVYPGTFSPSSPVNTAKEEVGTNPPGSNVSPFTLGVGTAAVTNTATVSAGAIPTPSSNPFITSSSRPLVGRSKVRFGRAVKYVVKAKH